MLHAADDSDRLYRYKMLYHIPEALNTGQSVSPFLFTPHLFDERGLANVETSVIHLD